MAIRRLVPTKDDRPSPERVALVRGLASGLLLLGLAFAPFPYGDAPWSDFRRRGFGPAIALGPAGLLPVSDWVAWPLMFAAYALTLRLAHARQHGTAAWCSLAAVHNGSWIYEWYRNPWLVPQWDNWSDGCGITYWVAFAATFLCFHAVGWAYATGPVTGPGRCQSCGYDLRTSPARCPECGAIAEPLPPADAKGSLFDD